ncbi:TPA: hypothetical protein PFR81_001924 [Clostridioides difficile]|nr:hypothetical protein [Clostridioides difficile]
MCIIKTVYKFDGNTLQRNAKRVQMIRDIKDSSNLTIIIKRFLDNVKNYNLKNVRYIIENELFFERISVDMICRYMDKLNKYENIECIFEEAYILKGENGFRRTVDYLVRQTY